MSLLIRISYPPQADARGVLYSRFTLYVLILAGLLQLSVLATDNADNFEVNPKSEMPHPTSLPSALEILAQVRANFSREALFIKGQILSGGRLGKLERACYIEMFLELGEDPATASYKISDAFGTPFEQMTISMNEGGEAKFEYESGNPLRPAAAPPPTGVIRDTDVTWNDLTLLFLWRMDGRTVRKETLRGRDCYVLAFPRQESGTIWIWIDMQMLMLIQMDDTDRDGKLQRRMTVKNIKKISDQWMIKNMEIRSYSPLHHTLIRIDEVFTLDY